MILDELITDRTAADVQRRAELAAIGWANMTAAQKTEWASDLKGAYNAGDLNRVGEAIQYVADHLAQYDYNVSVSPKTDWAEEDIPTDEQLDAYLADIETIRTALTPVLPVTPESMNGLTYAEANEIEEIFGNVEALIFGMIAAFRHCGTLHANEGGLIL